MTSGVELNLDGIVGPTHFYGGLSFGNVASMVHKDEVSNPKAAALQGLDKCLMLHRMGIKQAILPPHERPHIETLRRLGFYGTENEVLTAVTEQAPHILFALSSAACMWTANAATISPSADTADHKVHITSANLTHSFHRSIEARFNHTILKRLFPSEEHFVHHPPLPSIELFSDEGAANHSRLCLEYAKPGIEVFVYGRTASTKQEALPKRFPARQTREASEAIARLHRLDKEATLFFRQHPDAIDAGVFHNDVISVGNKNVFFYHKEAFDNTEQAVQRLQAAFEKRYKQPLILVESQLPIEDVVQSYLFNSQLVSTSESSMALITPIECQENSLVKAYLDEVIQSPENPIKAVHPADIRQSMHNGGGPACLRLRAALTEQEFETVHKPILFSEKLYNTLTNWVKDHYRDRLALEDIKDPQLLDENHRALDVLSQILELGSIYPFQQ